ncbi:MAG: hypothetical protein AB7G75_36625 [Candidatus Binatia bacterium]
MNSIIFHSLYTDPAFNSFKHSLFYFDKLVIPEGGFIFAKPGPNETSTSHAYLVSLVPEQAYNDIQALTAIGAIETIDAEHTGSELKFEQIVQFVYRETKGKNNLGNYTPAEITSVFQFLDFVEPERLLSNSLAVEMAQEIALVIGVFCLQLMAYEKKIACLDNQLTFDAVSLGVQRILDDKSVRASFQSAGFHRYKSTLLAQRLLSLNLPSFEFRSFQDVLELKEKFRDEIGAFRTEMDRFALEIEKTPLDADFLPYLKIFADSKIHPQVEELKRKIRLSPSSFLGTLLNTSLAGVSLYADANSIFSHHVTTAVILGSAIHLSKEIKELLSTREEAMRNGLSLLLKVK